MRWGVREDASMEHTTTELCLQEIVNCQQVSAGPYFVVSSSGAFPVHFLLFFFSSSLSLFFIFFIIIKIVFDFFFVYNSIVPMGFLPWEIQVAFPGESQPQQIHTTQCMVYAGCLSVSIIHQTLDMDYSIFNMHTDVNTCDCARGCADTLRESALKVYSGRKIRCHTEESNLHQQCANPRLYQLSYIPAPYSCIHKM